jgi:F-type H+-transporting ATPase subunit gamma
MAAGIGSALLLMPQPVTETRQEHRRRAFIVCTAEHGFVGGFNERMLEAADAALEPSDLLFVLGSRGAALAFERGRKVAWTRPMATRLAGAPDAVGRLTSELYARIACGEIARVDIIFSRYCQGAASTIERRLLLPLDVAPLLAKPARQVPLHNLPPRPLLEKVMAEYVFALLTEAAVESIASENAARFAAMESAHDNVSKKLAGLQQNARQARQTEITSELLDLITGAEAMGIGSRRVICPSRAISQPPHHSTTAAATPTTASSPRSSTTSAA